jgi:hypothetical protein
MELAFHFIARSLAKRRNNDPPWKGINRELKSIALLLEYYDDACKIISTKEATVAFECAIYIVKSELIGHGRNRSFRPQVFCGP